MSLPGSKVFGTFTLSTATANAGTAFTRLIPPWRGAGIAPLLYKHNQGRPNWHTPGAYTTLTQLTVTDGGTAHDYVVMRPFNYALVTTDVAANAATFILADDPGLYATTYKYALPAEAGGVVSAVADNAIAASDYVAYQLRDGTWILDTVSSGTYAALVLATSTPNVTGGGVEAGTPMFFFGVAANSDPATGTVNPTLKAGAASSRINLLPDNALGGLTSLRPGQPMFIYNANASNASTLNVGHGCYMGGV